MKRILATGLVLIAMLTTHVAAQQAASSPAAPTSHHGVITDRNVETVPNCYLVKMDDGYVPGLSDRFRVERTDPNTHQVYNLGEGRVYRIDHHTRQVYLIDATLNPDVGGPEIGDDVTSTPRETP